MSIKRRFVALGVVGAVVLGAWFFAGFRPAQSRLGDVKSEVEQTQAEVSALQDRLAKLQALQSNEGELRERAEALAAALPNDPGLPDFLRYVEEAAAHSGISFLSVTPSLPAAASGSGDPAEVSSSGVQAITVQITADGRYFALEEFVLKLERLRRAVRIDSFTLSSTDNTQASPALSLQMSLQVFMAAPVAAAPSDATVPDNAGQQN